MRAIWFWGSCVLLAALVAPAAYAGEGGTGHYVPGALATLIDLPPTRPGWVVEGAYLNYRGDASRNLPVAGDVAVGLDVRSDVALFGGFYTFELPADGLFYTVGGFLPYVWMRAEAQVLTPLGARARRDTASGIGDLTLIPVMVAWKSGFWQANAVLPIYAPTGDYDVDRLANPGLNYWTFDPTIGGSYNDEKIGFNAALHVGISFNTDNSATDYKSGELFHLETSAQQLLPLGPGFLSIGAEFFYLEQVGGDSGSGARFGGFERRSLGIGPALGYVLPWRGDNFAAELRWLPEIETRRQLEGDFVWLKLIYQF